MAHLGKSTHSQPNSSKSIVRGHMQHSVVSGSCSSEHVLGAVRLALGQVITGSSQYIHTR